MSTVPEMEAVGTLTFHQALLQAEAQARSTLDVALHERLSAAVALVQGGAVFQANDHTWTVASASTPGKAYSPNGTCICDYINYNKQIYCKHQLAMFLSQRVLTLMRNPTPPVVPEVVEPWPDNDDERAVETAPTPAPDDDERAVETAPAPGRLPEAPALPEVAFSLTLKGTLDGQDAMLTVRAMTAAEFQRNLATVRGLLDPPAPASPPASPQADDAPTCKYHGAMTASTKAPGTFFCTRKLADGSYCPSRFPAH